MSIVHLKSHPSFNSGRPYSDDDPLPAFLLAAHDHGLSIQASRRAAPVAVWNGDGWRLLRDFAFLVAKGYMMLTAAAAFWWLCLGF